MDEDRRALLDEVSSLGYGSLGGLGIEAQDTVKQKLDSQGRGWLFDFHCDACGKPMTVLVPWDELVFMSQGLPPPNNSWLHDPRVGYFVPNLQCNCSKGLRLGVNPEEATRLLKSAIASGKIRQDQVQGMVASIQQGIRR